MEAEQATEAKIRRLEIELMRARELVENQNARMEVMEARLSAGQAVSCAEGIEPLSAKSYSVAELKVVRDVGQKYYNFDQISPRSTVGSGLSCYAMGEQVDLVIAVLVFGRNLKQIEHAVQEVISNQRRTRAFKPVFFTDHSVFTPFRRTRLVYEYFPKISGGIFVAGRADDYADFQQEKFIFALKKWGIETILDMSKSCPVRLS